MKLVEVKPIFEGNKALSDLGISRIKREDIPSTINHFCELASISKEDLHVIGSTEKLATSGDIDLAIDSNRFNPEHIDAMMRSKGIVGKYNKGLQVASYAIPIKGDKNNGLVQVDLMFSPNVEWAKFAYHSPGEGSRFKGAVRTVLLSAVAAILNEPGTDHFDYDGGELVTRAGRTLHLPTGLKRIFQYRPRNTAGDGYLMSMKNIEVDDFKKMYPNVELRGGRMNVDDPQKVIKILFGSGVTPKDVESAEQVIHLIKKKFSKQDQDQIFKIAAKRLKDLRGKARLPQEIEDAFEKSKVG